MRVHFLIGPFGQGFTDAADVPTSSNHPMLLICRGVRHQPVGTPPCCVRRILVRSTPINYTGLFLIGPFGAVFYGRSMADLLTSSRLPMRLIYRGVRHQTVGTPPCCVRRGLVRSTPINYTFLFLIGPFGGAFYGRSMADVPTAPISPCG